MLSHVSAAAYSFKTSGNGCSIRWDCLTEFVCLGTFGLWHHDFGKASGIRQHFLCSCKAAGASEDPRRDAGFSGDSDSSWWRYQCWVNVSREEKPHSWSCGLSDPVNTGTFYGANCTTSALHSTVFFFLFHFLQVPSSVLFTVSVRTNMKTTFCFICVNDFHCFFSRLT